MSDLTFNRVGMLPPPIFTQPPPLPVSHQPSWIMSPHLRGGSIRPATSEPHLPGFASHHHHRSPSPLNRHPRSHLQTHVPPPNFVPPGQQQQHGQSFYDDGSCLSVAKQLSETRLGVYSGAPNAEEGAITVAGSGVPAGGVGASSPHLQRPDGGGQPSGRTHSPLARQNPISSAYEPFFRSLSPQTAHHSPPQPDHLRVSGPSRRGRSISPDVHNRPQQQPPMFAAGGGNYEQQFPPPNVVRDRLQSDSTVTGGNMDSGPTRQIAPLANQALNKLTRQNSCSDTQLNVTTG